MDGLQRPGGGKNSIGAAFGTGPIPVMPDRAIKPTEPTKSSSGFRLRKSLERNSVGSICFVWLRLAAECSYA